MATTLTKILPDGPTIVSDAEDQFGTDAEAAREAGAAIEAAFAGDPPAPKGPPKRPAEPVATVATEPAAPAEPVPPAHPSHLLKAAEALDIEPELVASLSSDALLLVVAREARRARQSAAAATREQTIAPPTPAAPDFWAELGEYEDDDGAGNKLKKPFSKDTLHPAVAKPMEHLARQVADLKRSSPSGPATRPPRRRRPSTSSSTPRSRSTRTWGRARPNRSTPPTPRRSRSGPTCTGG
jgi:hypothetical protein